MRLLLPIQCDYQTMRHDWKAVIRFRTAAGIDAVVPAAVPVTP